MIDGPGGPAVGAPGTGVGVISGVPDGPLCEGPGLPIGSVDGCVGPRQPTRIATKPSRNTRADGGRPGNLIMGRSSVRDEARRMIRRASCGSMGGRGAPVE